ncbi:hypothetical protein CO608_07035 [Lysobacteraceae bacterium NML08-0793]|nr:hypothetical protein CO608_07035 [Xanthomonadaceae bacterium NML08-0793]
MSVAPESLAQRPARGALGVAAIMAARGGVWQRSGSEYLDGCAALDLPVLAAAAIGEAVLKTPAVPNLKDKQ